MNINFDVKLKYFVVIEEHEFGRILLLHSFIPHSVTGATCHVEAILV